MHDNKVGLDFVEQNEVSANEPGWVTLIPLVGVLLIGFLCCCVFAGEMVRFAVAYTYEYWEDNLGEVTAARQIERGFEACEQSCSSTWVNVGRFTTRLPSDTPIFELLFGCSENPCEISGSPGGTSTVYELAALAALARPELRFKVVGYCASACARFLDLARAQVCLTPKAQVGLHMGTTGYHTRVGYKKTSYHLPSLSDDLVDEVRRLGGFPPHGKAVYLTLEQARRIWSDCDEPKPSVLQVHSEAQPRAVPVEFYTWPPQPNTGKPKAKKIPRRPQP